jgi:hypothetical protein
MRLRHAEGAFVRASYGGIYGAFRLARLTLQNDIFASNRSKGNDAAGVVLESGASALVKDCAFSNNAQSLVPRNDDTVIYVDGFDSKSMPLNNSDGQVQDAKAAPDSMLAADDAAFVQLRKARSMLIWPATCACCACCAVAAFTGSQARNALALANPRCGQSGV